MKDVLAGIRTAQAYLVLVAVNDSVSRVEGWQYFIDAGRSRVQRADDLTLGNGFERQVLGDNGRDDGTLVFVRAHTIFHQQVMLVRVREE